MSLTTLALLLSPLLTTVALIKLTAYLRARRHAQYRSRFRSAATLAEQLAVNDEWLDFLGLRY